MWKTLTLQLGCSMCQDKWSDGMFVSHKIQTDAKLCKPIKESNDLAPNRLRRQPDALRLSRPAGLSICQLFARTWSHWLWWDYCCFKVARFQNLSSSHAVEGSIFALLSSLRDINWRPSLLSSCHLPISGTFYKHYSLVIFAGIAEQQGRLQWPGKASRDLMRKLQSTSVSNQPEERCFVQKLQNADIFQNESSHVKNLTDHFVTTNVLSARCRNALWHCAWAWVWARWALVKTLVDLETSTDREATWTPTWKHSFLIFSPFLQFRPTIFPMIFSDDFSFVRFFFISGDGTWAFVHDVPLGWGAGSVAVPRWDLQRQNIPEETFSKNTRDVKQRTQEKHEERQKHF